MEQDRTGAGGLDFYSFGVHLHAQRKLKCVSGEGI